MKKDIYTRLREIDKELTKTIQRGGDAGIIRHLQEQLENVRERIAHETKAEGR